MTLLCVDDRFDLKGKFEEEKFMTAAISVLDSRTAVYQAEAGRAMAIEDFHEAFDVEEIYVGGSGAEDAGVTLDMLLERYWKTAKLDQNERLGEEDFLAVAHAVLPCRRYATIEGVFRHTKKLEHLRKRAKTDGGLPLADFKEFLYHLLFFPEQIRLFRKYAKKSRDFLSVLEFKALLKREQKIKNSERIMQLVYNLAVDNKIQTQHSFEVFGPHLSHNGEGSISIFGFINFMQSDENCECPKDLSPCCWCSGCSNSFLTFPLRL